MLTKCSSIPSEFSAMIVILVQFIVYGILWSLILPLSIVTSVSLHWSLTTIVYVMSAVLVQL